MCARAGMNIDGIITPVFCREIYLVVVTRNYAAYDPRGRQYACRGRLLSSYGRRVGWRGWVSEMGVRFGGWWALRCNWVMHKMYRIVPSPSRSDRGRRGGSLWAQFRSFRLPQWYPDLPVQAIQVEYAAVLAMCASAWAFRTNFSLMTYTSAFCVSTKDSTSHGRNGGGGGDRGCGGDGGGDLGP